MQSSNARPAQGFLLVLSVLTSFFFLTACFSTNNESSGEAVGDASINVRLVSEQQVPPVVSPAQGEIDLEVNQSSGEIGGTLVVSGLSGDASSAHIQAAEAGLSGDIVISLEQDEDNDNQWHIPANSFLSSAQLTELQEGKTYINVNTSTHPSGEIRGQILPASYRLMRVNLVGSNVVPEVSSAARGIAYITLNTEGLRRISGNVRLTGLDNLTTAHIESGFAGLNGDRLFDFTADSSDSELLTLSATDAVTSKQLEQVLAGGMYISVRSSAHSAGEIRGQILPEGVSVMRTTLSGDFQVEPVISGGTAIAYTTLNNNDDGSITANIRSNDLFDATTAFLYSGYAGVTGDTILELEQDAANQNLWTTPENSSLETDQIERLLAGGLYYNLHSQTNSSGELRGQVVVNGIVVTRTVLSGDQVIPGVTTSASGIGYSTVNLETGAITANVRTDDFSTSVSAVHIHEGEEGSNGEIAISLTQDEDESALWSTVLESKLDADQLKAFNADALYFNVHSNAHPEGEIRGQISP